MFPSSGIVPLFFLIISQIQALSKFTDRISMSLAMTHHVLIEVFSADSIFREFQDSIAYPHYKEHGDST